MIKKCITCGREFECYDKAKKSHGRGMKMIKKRRHKAKTCSKKCSIAYTRAYMKAFQKTDKYKEHQKAYYQRRKEEKIEEGK